MSSRTADREHRIGMYADWLSHDADGLAFNLQSHTSLSVDDEYQILVAAKLKLVEATKHLDGALFANRLKDRSVA